MAQISRRRGSPGFWGCYRKDGGEVSRLLLVDLLALLFGPASQSQGCRGVGVGSTGRVRRRAGVRPFIPLLLLFSPPRALLCPLTFSRAYQRLRLLFTRAAQPQAPMAWVSAPHANAAPEITLDLSSLCILFLPRPASPYIPNAFLEQRLVPGAWSMVGRSARRLKFPMGTSRGLGLGTMYVLR